MKKVTKVSFMTLPMFLPILAVAGAHPPADGVALKAGGGFGSNLAFGLAMLGILGLLLILGSMVHYRHRAHREALRKSNHEMRSVYMRLGVPAIAAFLGLAMALPHTAEAQQVAKFTDPADIFSQSSQYVETVENPNPVLHLVKAAAPVAPATPAGPVKVEVTNPAASTTVVQVPTGDLADMGIRIIMLILTGLATAALAYVPFPLRGLVKSILVDKMLKEAETFAHNAIPNAKKGDEVSIETGNEILALGLRHALTWPASVVKWAGGEERIVQQLFARLNLPSNASINQFDVKAP